MFPVLVRRSCVSQFSLGVTRTVAFLPLDQVNHYYYYFLLLLLLFFIVVVVVVVVVSCYEQFERVKCQDYNII